jgi:ElaB/YqjD/DUF883 family membrane-anchored ribosome-binding protein
MTGSAPRPPRSRSDGVLAFIRELLAAMRDAVLRAAEVFAEASEVFLRSSGVLGRGLRLSVLAFPIDAAELLVRQRPSLRTQNLRRAVAALEEASTLIAELDRDLKQRTEQLTALQQEYEHYSELATVEEEKARALLEEVEETVQRGRWRERGIAAAINVVTGGGLFLLGLWIGGS